MTDPGKEPSVTFPQLPGVPVDAIIAITSNEPTPDDPVYVRHLKNITARSVQERLKSRHSVYSKDSRGNDAGPSLKSKTSETSTTGSPVQSISSRTTHSMTSGSSSRSHVESRPWMYKDGTFVFFTNLSLGVFGMFWTIQALFIEELMERVGVNLPTMGYLFACVRLGKIFGHLVTVPLTTVFPDRIIHILVSCMCLFAFIFPLVAFTTSPVFFGINFFALGTIYGIADSSFVLIIQMLQCSQRSFHTNMAYAISATFCFCTSIFIQTLKVHVTETKERLLWSTLITSGFSLSVATSVFVLNCLRESHTYYMINESEARFPSKFKGFRHYLFSFTLLSWAAFSAIFCMSTFWNFTLLVTKNAAANLTSDQVFIAVQVFMGSMMAIRIIAVPIVYFYENKTVIVATCNGILCVAALASVLLQDRMFEGIIMILLAYGIGIGMFHNSLLNWLQDHIAITPKTSLPFFLASASGIVLAPIVVPHIITDKTGAVVPSRFIWLTFSLTVSTVTAATILMTIEKLKEDLVEDIEIMPSIIAISHTSYSKASYSVTTSMATTRRGASSSKNGSHNEDNPDKTSWRKSRLSKLSTYTQRLDPVLSFISSIN